VKAVRSRAMSRVALGFSVVLACGCGGEPDALPPSYPESAPPGLYTQGYVGPGYPGYPAYVMPTAQPPLTAQPAPTGPAEFSTRRDGEGQLAAITGGTAQPAPTGDPGDPGEVVARMQPSFRDCFEQALKSDPKTGGSITLDALLLPTGGVASITPTDNKGLSAGVVTCATAVVAKARFRPPEGSGETHIQIPIRFRPRS
jgi:hypothetical protein